MEETHRWYRMLLIAVKKKCETISTLPLRLISVLVELSVMVNQVGELSGVAEESDSMVDDRRWIGERFAGYLCPVICDIFSAALIKRENERSCLRHHDHRRRHLDPPSLHLLIFGIQLRFTMMMSSLIARRFRASMAHGPARRGLSAMVSLEYEFPG
jgi:hypothetical protein